MFLNMLDLVKKNVWKKFHLRPENWFFLTLKKFKNKNSKPKILKKNLFFAKKNEKINSYFLKTCFFEKG